MSEAADEPTANDPAGRADEPVMTVDKAAHAVPTESDIDLTGIEADLDGVQAALARLADGTYWTDEVTGAPIAPDALMADPLARRA